MKGDALRFKRAQLRLQREDVLNQIVRLARDKIGDLKQIDTPVPNKFLVPFLEQASLESPDSSLIDMWASLLASAAEEFRSHHTHFVSIISQLSPKQGLILKSLVGTEDGHTLQYEMGDVLLYYQSHEIRRTIGRLIGSISASGSDFPWDGKHRKRRASNDRSASGRHRPLEPPEASATTDQRFAELVADLFNRCGIELVYLAMANVLTNDYDDITPDYMTHKDEDDVDYSILEAVGLIRKVETGFFDAGNFSFFQ